jgi:quinol-cytochrome oxidoreductase complex cytochrome b subunit
MVLLLLFIVMRFGFPYLFMDSENFIEAKFLVTPVHIQPE